MFASRLIFLAIGAGRSMRRSLAKSVVVSAIVRHDFECMTVNSDEAEEHLDSSVDDRLYLSSWLVYGLEVEGREGRLRVA